MTLKDISFSGFFKIFFVVQVFLLLLGCLAFTVAYIASPESLMFNDPKLFGILSLKLSGTYNSPINLFVLGIANMVGSAIFYSLIAMLLGKAPFIGRIKIAPKSPEEHVFD